MSSIASRISAGWCSSPAILRAFEQQNPVSDLWEIMLYPEIVELRARGSTSSKSRRNSGMSHCRSPIS